MSRQKTVLLRSAWKRGPGPFLRQALRSARDTLWLQRHMVYRMDAERAARLAPAPEGFAVRRAADRADLPPALRERLERERDALQWGDFGWFDAGWQLWIGESDGAAACLCWVRPPGRHADFFSPLPLRADLIWQTSTLPEHRGRGLYDAVLAGVMRARAAEGIEAFYISCRDYNATSRRTFARMGWDWVGAAELPLRGGARRWRPARPPVPAAELEGMA